MHLVFLYYKKFITMHGHVNVKFRTMILRVIFYGCGTCSLTLKKKSRDNVNGVREKVA